MEKKKWVKFAGFAMLVLLSLFLCVGCAADVTEQDRLVSVSFSAEDDVSRGLLPKYGEIVSPEECFWTYTAVKTEGLYATGASEKDKDGKLIEQPVSDVKGLSGVSKRFSQEGKWKFCIFGYADSNYTKLVYTAEKTDVTLNSVENQVLAFSLQGVGTSSTLTFTANFASKADKAYTECGVLETGRLYLTVPHGYTFSVDSAVVVEIWENNTKIASSYTSVMTYDITSGTVMNLSPFVFESGKENFSEGVHSLTIKAFYSDVPAQGATAVLTGLAVKTYPVFFYRGVVTTLTGDLSDLVWLKPIGGRIYHDAGANGATYTFYKADGTKISWTSGVDNLKDACFYTVENLAALSNDRFYVYDNTNLASGSVSFGALSASDYLIGNDMTGIRLGDGKKRTLIALSKRPEFILIYGLLGGVVGQGNIQTIRMSCRYDAATYIAHYYGTNPVIATRNTIWSYIDYLNNGDPDGRYAANSNVSFLEKIVNPGSCNDWYVPNIEECGLLGLWCGAWKNSGDTSLVYSSAAKPGKYVDKGGSAPTGDADKTALWNQMSANGSDKRNFYCCDECGVDLAARYYQGYKYWIASGSKANSGYEVIAIRSF